MVAAIGGLKTSPNFVAWAPINDDNLEISSNGSLTFAGCSNPEVEFKLLSVDCNCCKVEEMEAMCSFSSSEVGIANISGDSKLLYV